MKSYSIKNALEGVGNLDFQTLSSFNKGTVGTFKSDPSDNFSPWELHIMDDEFLFIVEGKIEIEILKPVATTKIIVSAGEFCVVPKGFWHRQKIIEPMVQVWVTPGETEHSMADDPRV